MKSLKNDYKLFNSELDNRKNILNEKLIIDCILSADDIRLYDGIGRTMFENPKSIFITGGTGFVGAHLVTKLLSETSSNLYLLVRSENETRAKNKVFSTFQKY